MQYFSVCCCKSFFSLLLLVGWWPTMSWVKNTTTSYDDFQHCLLTIWLRSWNWKFFFSLSQAVVIWQHFRKHASKTSFWKQFSVVFRNKILFENSSVKKQILCKGTTIHLHTMQKFSKYSTHHQKIVFVSKLQKTIF